MLTPLLWWTLLMLLWLLFIGYQFWIAVLGKHHRNKPYFFRNDPIYGVTGTCIQTKSSTCIQLENDTELLISKNELVSFTKSVEYLSGNTKESNTHSMPLWLSGLGLSNPHKCLASSSVSFSLINVTKSCLKSDCTSWVMWQFLTISSIPLHFSILHHLLCMRDNLLQTNESGIKTGNTIPATTAFPCIISCWQWQWTNDY